MKKYNSIEIYQQLMRKRVLYIGFKMIISLVMIIGFAFSVKAQKTWDLTKCINYALENNIDLNQKYNQIEIQQFNLLESKANLLPDLNIGSTINMNYGRNIDGNTNAITYDKTLGNNYWINSSISIFQGLVKFNTIRFNKYLLSANKEEAVITKNRLIFNVLISYYTVEYSIGLKNVAQSQGALSKMQFERMKRLVDVGKESPITVQELKSQWANDKLSLTRAKNNMSKTILDLKQLLRLNVNQAFEIDPLNMVSVIATSLPNIDSIYNTAVNILPEIKQKEYLLNASKKDLAIAKGGISPRIYLAAGINTNYFDGNDSNYNTQIKNNQNQWVNMGISIPIFNGASVYSKVKRKIIAVQDKELELEKQKDVLYTEIWSAVDDRNSAEKEYLSAFELQEYSELAFLNVSKKMEKGLASATDYEAAKQRFVTAEAALLKAKLIYIMRKQMLEFYKTGNWSHLYN